MNREVRDHLIQSFEHAAVEMSGATIDDFYALMEKAERWIRENLPGFFKAMQSHESFSAWLDTVPDEFEPHMQMAAELFRLLPRIAANELIRFAHHFAQQNPLIKAGRPQAIPENMKPAVIAFIGKLITEGVRSTAAQMRASRHFNVTLRSVQRVWSNRENYVSPSPQSLAEVFALLQGTSSLSSQG